MTNLSLSMVALLLAGQAAPPGALELPAPRKTGGMPLMEALARRATSREFDTKDLPLEHLSNVLWAGFGVNRPDGKRTAPSSHDRREMEIYVLLKQGAYVYDATKHLLAPVLAEDIRALGGKQDFVRDAPVTLVYVADLAKMGDAPAAEKQETAAIDSGFISQNVYLYCASEGLATGVRAYVDVPALGKRLGLRPDQRITAAQSIGYPKK
ncbi:MAG TPA: nitroreductase family protein [Vicinamibacteria bacterium]|nr:nitroreductase family protein [Vicinamibacteria bacterium]